MTKSEYLLPVLLPKQLKLSDMKIRYSEKPKNERTDKKSVKKPKIRFATYILSSCFLLGCAVGQKAPTAPENTPAVSSKTTSEEKRAIITKRIDEINYENYDKEINQAASFFVEISDGNAKEWLEEIIKLADEDLSEDKSVFWDIVKRMVARHSESDPSVAVDLADIMWRDNYSSEAWIGYMLDLINEIDFKTQKKILKEIFTNELTDHSSVLGLLILYNTSKSNILFAAVADYWHIRIDNYEEETSGPFNILYNIPALLSNVKLKIENPFENEEFMKDLGWYDEEKGELSVVVDDEIKQNIAYGLSLLSKEDLIKVHEKFNILYFIRYPPYIIKNLAETANGKKLEKPIALIITPKADHNGAFYLDNSPLRGSKESVYDFIIFEAGTEKEAFDFMYGFSEEYPPINLLAIFGHGGDYVGYGGCNAKMECSVAEFSGAYLGGPSVKEKNKAYVWMDDYLYIDTWDKTELEKLAKKLEFTDDAVIVIHSCMGGADEGLGPMLRKIFQLPVLDIEKDYSNPNFTYDEEGKLKSMTYTP